MNPLGIWWVREDQRLEDHAALWHMSQAGVRILPVFVYSQGDSSRYGEAARYALYHSLQSLGERLLSLGGRLIILRAEDPAVALLELANHTHACGVWCHRVVDPIGRAEEARLEAGLERVGSSLHGFWGDQFRDPASVYNKSGNPYQVFTPFYNALSVPQEVSYPVRADRLPWVNGGDWPSVPLDSLDLLPKSNWTRDFPRPETMGAQGALATLREFKERVQDYSLERDFPARNGSSHLSVALRMGWISPQRICAELANLGEGAQPYIRQLWWREFARHLLYHYPHTVEKPFHRNFEKFPWKRNSEWLERWQKGETGYALVDAGMHELWATGTMHNRVRMVVASFLTKDLLIPWQDGLRWFRETLLDEDVANNVFGWQWSAGCGADGAPFFRIFNPAEQAKRYDPQGVYCKRWASARPALPIVDHAEARRVALAGYAQCRSQGL